MSYISISTAQNIDVQYELAGLGSRILAALLDYVLFMAYFIVAMLLLSQTQPNQSLSSFLGYFILLFPIMLYHLLCEIFLNGQSVGKRIMKIKVISLDGGQPSFGQYVMRWLFRLVDIALSQGVIAVVSVAATNRAQRLGDLAANTTVVSTKPKKSLQQTIYMPTIENYVAVYLEVSRLSSEDIQLIKDVLLMQHQDQGYYLAVETANKIENVLNIKRKEDPLNFLRIVLTDYNHII